MDDLNKISNAEDLYKRALLESVWNPERTWNKEGLSDGALNGRALNAEALMAEAWIKIPVVVDGSERALYATDKLQAARELKRRGEAVVVWLHEGNKGQDFGGFPYAVEDPGALDAAYAERVYRRLNKLPWKILETDRCVVRETTSEDVDSFYRIYSDPEITRYMEDLYPEIEQEKEYVREYIDKVYAFYEFGVWTVLEKESGEVMGRAGFSYRQGYDEPEIGYIIGVPWQRHGYAEEVCRAILEYGWRELHFERVQALVETENEPSLTLCDKLGFIAVEELEINGRGFFRLIQTAPP